MKLWRYRSISCPLGRRHGADLLVEFAPGDFYLLPTVRVCAGVSLCWLWFSVGVTW